MKICKLILSIPGKIYSFIAQEFFYTGIIFGNFERLEQELLKNPNVKYQNNINVEKELVLAKLLFEACNDVGKYIDTLYSSTLVEYVRRDKPQFFSTFKNNKKRSACCLKSYNDVNIFIISCKRTILLLAFFMMFNMLLIIAIIVEIIERVRSTNNILPKKISNVFLPVAIIVFLSALFLTSMLLVSFTKQNKVVENLENLYNKSGANINANLRKNLDYVCKNIDYAIVFLHFLAYHL